MVCTAGIFSGVWPAFCFVGNIWIFAAGQPPLRRGVALRTGCRMVAAAAIVMVAAIGPIALSDLFIWQGINRAATPANTAV